MVPWGQEEKEDLGNSGKKDVHVGGWTVIVTEDEGRTF